jgi:hypothetical protein
MAREKRVCWSHLGDTYDIGVYHVGGSRHWLEITEVADGRLITKRAFNGEDARTRAVAAAVRAFENLRTPDEEVEEMFDGMVKDATPFMNALPKYGR